MLPTIRELHDFYDSKFKKAEGSHEDYKKFFELINYALKGKTLMKKHDLFGRYYKIRFYSNQDYSSVFPTYLRVINSCGWEKVKINKKNNLLDDGFTYTIKYYF